MLEGSQSSLGQLQEDVKRRRKKKDTEISSPVPSVELKVTTAKRLCSSNAAAKIAFNNVLGE